MAKKALRIPEDVRRQWSKTYAETKYDELPWFSPKPYPWIAERAQGKVWHRGTRLLDIGCGAGTNSIFLARQGFEVSGVDLAEGAIAAARSRAQRAGVKVDFRVADALDLPYADGAFGGAIDIGCFHTLPSELRGAYAKEVARVVRPRRTFLLSWVAREFRGERGPAHRASLEEVTSALEGQFLFLRSEFRPSAFRRATAGGLPVYCAELGRRSFPQPPAR